MRDQIHPGEHVQEEIEALGLTPEAFAEQLGVPVSRVQSLVDGKSNLDADMALRLGHYFRMSPDFWLKLQNLYDLRCAEARLGESLQQLPVAKHLQAA